MFAFKARVAEFFASVRSALSRRFARGDTSALSAPDARTLMMRRSRVLASLFPCYLNKKHKHKEGAPHTCNTHLLGPRIKRGRPRRIGAHKFVVSHYVGMRTGRRVGS